MTFTHALATNNYGPAKFIVSSNAYEGTHTTITAALTAATSGDTIFIRPGTYTENLTLKAGVNLAAFEGDDDTPNVTISGKATFSTVGTISISNIRLQTNSDFFLVLSGSVASIIYLKSCYLNCSNNTGISYTSSSASSQIYIDTCFGNIGTTGIAYFANSSAGIMWFLNCFLTNTGASSTANTVSAGNVTFFHTVFSNPVTSSSTGSFGFFYSNIDTSATNSTSFTVGGSSVHQIFESVMYSGAASAITISQTLNIRNCIVDSSNTNAITGGGTINYSGLSFNNTSSTINTTTQVGGTLIGSKNTAPSSGFLGEQIRSVGTAVSVGNGSPTNITSINLTAGIWDISGLVVQTESITATFFDIAISVNTGSFTGTVSGDSGIQTSALGPNVAGLSIPSFRVTLSTTTTYYLVAQINYSVGAAVCNGRISGTRVG